MKVRIGLLALTIVLAACGEDGLVFTTAPTFPPETTIDNGDTTLDALVTACADGVFAACDELWGLAEIGSDLERFGASCGDRIELGDEAPFGDCVNRFVEPTTTTRPGVSITTLPPRPELQIDPTNNTWTVILRSVAEDEGIDSAIEYANRLREAGIEAAVFLSSNFPSLNPGYWVVYSGEYPDPDTAAAQCGEFTDRGIDCYHRFVGDE